MKQKLNPDYPVFANTRPWNKLILRGLRTFKTISFPWKYRGVVYLYDTKGKGDEDGVEWAAEDDIEISAGAGSPGCIVGTVEIYDCEDFEWRHRIALQEFFKDETTHELIDSLCRRAINEINRVIEDEKLRTDQKSENERDYFIKYLEQARDGFDGMIGAGEDESVKDRETNFNYILDELFDVGDWKIELSSGGLQKFMWIA